MIEKILTLALSSLTVWQVSEEQVNSQNLARYVRQNGKVAEDSNAIVYTYGHFSTLLQYRDNFPQGHIGPEDSLEIINQGLVTIDYGVDGFTKDDFTSLKAFTIENANSYLAFLVDFLDCNKP